MGWFYKTNEDCNLTGLGLAFNGTTGNVFGRTPVYDEDDPLLSTECEAILESKTQLATGVYHQLSKYEEIPKIFKDYGLWNFYLPALNGCTKMDT